MATLSAMGNSYHSGLAALESARTVRPLTLIFQLEVTRVKPVLISGPDRDYKTLSALAKGLRLAKRLTQTEAAELCGLTLTNVRAIENGEIGANYCYDYIFAIAERRKRKAKRTSGGKKRAGNLKKRSRKKSRKI